MSIGQQVTMTGSIFSPIWPFDRICIRVRYGIKSKELFFLKTEDLKQIKDGQYDFETKIKFFSSKLWSSSGTVLLCKVRLFYFCMVPNQRGSIHQRLVNQLPNCWLPGNFL